MTVIEITSASPNLTRSQRWSHYLVVIIALVALFVGLNLRNADVNATTTYIDNEAGINAQYPEDWLINTEGNRVFQVENAREIGYKTTFEVRVRPVSELTDTRNLLDILSLSRSQTLAAYTVLSITPYQLPNEQDATAMLYTFVDTQTNPFLESIPRVVEGLDILTIKRGQAIIISYRAEASRYEQNLPIFERFVSALEF